MDELKGVSELFTNCPNCSGSGCETCRGSGVVLSEKGRQAEALGKELFEELPPVPREQIEATIKKLRAAERGIRVVTDKGEFLPDPYKRPRRS